MCWSILKCIRNHLVLFVNLVKITLMNDEPSLSTVWALKMTEITDFRFRIRSVCLQLNKTGRPYDVIGHRK